MRSYVPTFPQLEESPLPPGIEVWVEPSGAALLAPALSPLEASYWQTLSHPRRRNEWKQGRLMAKLLLSQTLKKPPEAFEFLPQKAGPPRVQCYATPLEGWLSISHTDDYVGVAYAPFAMGLDICGAAEGARLQQVAHRAFSEEEVALCWDCPEYLPALWALKEAALKMLGGGIFSPGLSSICVKGLFPPHFAFPRAEARLYVFGGAFVALAFEGEA